MSTVTLRPNGTVNNIGGALTGGATLHAVLSDDSDSSYVTDYDPNTTDRGTVDLDTTSLPAGSRIKRVDLRARFGRAAPAPGAVGALNLTLPGVSTETWNANVGWATPTTITVGSIDGEPAAAISGWQAEIRPLGLGCDLVRIYELYVDIVHVEQPVVDTVTVEATDTNLPRVEWEATLDPDGGSQSFYEVTIYNEEAWVNDGEPILESGILDGKPTFWQSTQGLPADTYHAVVRVAQTVNGEPLWSEEEETSFSIDVLLPGIPTLVLTPEASEGRIKLAIAAVPVEGGGVEEPPPTGVLVWDYPTEGAIVSGVLGEDPLDLDPDITHAEVTVNPSGSNWRVRFYLDGSGTAMDAGQTSEPYSPSLDTTTLSNGSHFLTARLYTLDTDELVAFSSINFTVSNVSASAVVKRRIPVMANGFIGQFNLCRNNRYAARRFVLKQAVTFDRIYSTFKLEGAVDDEGNVIGVDDGYGNGDGGLNRVRLCWPDGAGLPNLSSVFASEANIVGGERWRELRDEFGLGPRHPYLSGEFSAVTVPANTPFWEVWDNQHATPGPDPFQGNHSSPDYCWCSLSQAGLNAQNNLNAEAAGLTIAGQDARETTAWSEDSGSTWRFGDQVGWYSVGNGQAKLWLGHGIRLSPSGAIVVLNYPFATWPDVSGLCTVTYGPFPTEVTLTQAGGCTRSGSLGVVTATRTSDGAARTTPSLGSGVVTGNLNSPLVIPSGGFCRVAHSSGSVEVGDNGAHVGLLNRTALPFRSVGGGAASAGQCPSLFVLDANGEWPLAVY